MQVSRRREWCRSAATRRLASATCLVAVGMQLAGLLPAHADTTATMVPPAAEEATVTTTTSTTSTTTTTAAPTTTSTTAVPATTTTTVPAMTATVPATTTTVAPTLATTATTPVAGSAFPVAEPASPVAGEGGTSTQPPGPAGSTPVPSGSGRISASGGAFRRSQILVLLEAAAARRSNLTGQITEREAVLAQAEVERAEAEAEVRGARALEQLATARLARAESYLRGVDEILRRQPAVVVERARLRIPVTLNAPLAPLPGPGGLRGFAPPPPRPTLSPAYERAIRQLADLSASVRIQQQDVVAARQRAAVAQTTVAAKAAASEAFRRSLDDVREELWSVMRDDPATRQTRALSTAPDGQVVDPTPFAVAEIPAAYLDLYRRAAATCPGLSWTVVAAIGAIESSHGRLSAPGVHSGSNFAGAMGPMQFLAETWSGYGADGDGDGVRNVYAPADAVFGAANYLCASGAGSIARLAEAVWAYNHAEWYVDDVLALAMRFGVDGLGFGEAPADVKSLVENTNVILSAEARADLLGGVADPRVVKVLAAAAATHRIAVSVIKTGHSMFVAGTDRISNHYYGRGVDVYAVDGVDVSSANDAALDLALALLTSGPDLRPEEFGSPWSELSRFPGAFSDAGHQGHLHIAWRSDVP